MLSQDVEDWYPFLESPLVQTKFKPTGQTSAPLKMSWFCVYDIECPITDSIRFYTLSNDE